MRNNVATTEEVGFTEIKSQQVVELIQPISESTFFLRFGFLENVTLNRLN